jgi:FkbM family methyltransferase
VTRARIAFALARRVPAPIQRLLRGNRYAARLLRPLADSIRDSDVVIAEGPAAGLRFNVGSSNVGYALGTIEPLVQAELASLLAPGAVFYDIGANVGFFTVLGARLVGPGGTVVAYEPVHAYADALERNVELNGLGNVVVRRLAVAEAPGRRELELGATETTARLVPPGAASTTWVEATSLDAELRSGLPAPDVVKIDVEGAEVDVLDGMAETLRHHRPVILCEMHGRNREAGARLRAAGYALRVVDHEAASLEEAPWWVHVVATPARSS